MTFQIGDRVRRTQSFAHGNHRAGHECTIAEIVASGTYFRDGTLEGNDYGPYQYKLSNYELISRGPVEKKRSGFGKWIAKNELCSNYGHGVS